MNVDLTDKMAFWFLARVRVNDVDHIAVRVVNAVGEYDAALPDIDVGHPWLHVPTARIEIDPADPHIDDDTVYRALATTWPGLIDFHNHMEFDFNRDGTWGGFSSEGKPVPVARIMIDIGDRAEFPSLIYKPDETIENRQPVQWIEAHEITAMPVGDAGDISEAVFTGSGIACLAKIPPYGTLALQGNVADGFEMFYGLIFSEQPQPDLRDILSIGAKPSSAEPE